MSGFIGNPARHSAQQQDRDHPAIADVAVFDADRVIDRADFANPFQYADGFKATVVNGGVSFLDGERFARSGRAIR